MDSLVKASNIDAISTACVWGLWHYRLLKTVKMGDFARFQPEDGLISRQPNRRLLS
jgi:hypothetical protein